MTSSLVTKNRTPTRARGERVYKPGGKKEWRVVFWTHESTKPSRRQCSFSEAKYGKEAASLLSRAVLDYIDVKGVIPDDLHDPPILDPAKKELIEYYSALHESRKASQKKSKPKSNTNKNSVESSIVPLYTLAQTQSPITNSSLSPISNKLTKSEKIADLTGNRDRNINDSNYLNSSNSPNDSHISTPISIIANIGNSNNDDSVNYNMKKHEIINSNNNSLYNIQIPPIPNINSSSFPGYYTFIEGINSFDSNRQEDIGSINISNSLESNATKMAPNVNKNPLLSVNGNTGNFACLLNSLFPSQYLSGFHSSLSDIMSNNGFINSEVQNFVNQACQQFVYQNQIRFFNQLGYLQHLAFANLSNCGGTPNLSSSISQNNSIVYNQDVRGLNSQGNITNNLLNNAPLVSQNVASTPKPDVGNDIINSISNSDIPSLLLA